MSDVNEILQRGEAERIARTTEEENRFYLLRGVLDSLEDLLSHGLATALEDQIADAVDRGLEESTIRDVVVERLKVRLGINE